MEQWLLDPKSITLIGLVALSIATSIWRGEQTAAMLAEFVKWRQERVDKMLERHETSLATHEKEIERLRNAKEGK